MKSTNIINSLTGPHHLFRMWADLDVNPLISNYMYDEMTVVDCWITLPSGRGLGIIQRKIE